MFCFSYQPFYTKYVNIYSTCGLWSKNIQRNLFDVRLDLLVIYIKRNFDPYFGPIKTVFSQKDLNNWSKVLEYIGLRLGLPQGYVKRYMILFIIFYLFNYFSALACIQ